MRNTRFLLLITLHCRFLSFPHHIRSDSLHLDHVICGVTRLLFSRTEFEETTLSLKFAKRTAAGIFLLLTSATAGQASFCGNYIQTWSNAGQCKTCKLQIADNPEIQKYFVEANNGWSAELEFVEGDASVAAGNGRWKNVGGPYSGKPITIDMNQQGSTLNLTMSVSDGSVQGVIKATYRCTDPGRVEQTAAPIGLPKAASWGGVVRSGPGMSYRRITSLRQNERIKLLENTGVMMNGYPWFRIRYRGRRTGYQWGGIICSRGREIREIHRICQ